MKRTVAYFLASLLFFLALAGAFIVFKKADDPVYEQLTVAVSQLKGSSLIYIAQDLGYFEDNGLAVELIEDEMGDQSLSRLLNEEADLATVAGFPLVKAAFDDEDLALIATIHAENKNPQFFSLNASGIEHFSDLPGKTIAVPRGTIIEYFLYLFLLSNGIEPETVVVADMNYAQINQAIKAASIDGFFLVEAISYQIEDEVRELISSLHFENDKAIYPLYFNLITTSSVISERQDDLVAFLTSLQQAQDYLLDHPAEAHLIVSDALELSSNDSLDLDPETFDLGLDQALFNTMENQARWYAQYGSVDSTAFPNFLKMIKTDLLERLDPSLLRLINH